MGCCCPKQKSDSEDENDERARLLDNDHHQKSQFVQPNGVSSSGIAAQTSGGLASSNGNHHDSNLLDFGNYNGTSIGGGLIGSGDLSNSTAIPDGGAGGHNASQVKDNQMFEKILSEVINVSTMDQRSNTNVTIGAVITSSAGVGNIDLALNQMRDMPFKFKSVPDGSGAERKHYSDLPNGVLAPVTVLAAQSPFIDDIRLINTVAAEANACINNFTLQVPDNVAFDFKPVL